VSSAGGAFHIDHTDLPVLHIHPDEAAVVIGEALALQELQLDFVDLESLERSGENDLEGLGPALGGKEVAPFQFMVRSK
jgi:hypothetical protein